MGDFLMSIGFSIMVYGYLRLIIVLTLVTNVAGWLGWTYLPRRYWWFFWGFTILLPVVMLVSALIVAVTMYWPLALLAASLVLISRWTLIRFLKGQYTALALCFRLYQSMMTIRHRLELGLSRLTNLE